MCKGERAAAVSAGSRGNVVRDFLAISVGGAETDFRVALIVVLEIDAAIVGRPLRPLDVAVEFVGNRMRASSVAIHEI